MPRSCPQTARSPCHGTRCFRRPYPDHADRVYRLVMDHAAPSFHFEFVQLVYGSPHGTLDPDMRLVDEEHQNLCYGSEMVEIPPPLPPPHACWLWPRTNVLNHFHRVRAAGRGKHSGWVRCCWCALRTTALCFLRWDEPDEDDSDPGNHGGKWAANLFILAKSNKRARCCGRCADVQNLR